MRPKEFAKRHLGDTLPWHLLRRARHRLRRLKNRLAPVFARKAFYRRLQSPRFYDELYFDTPKNPSEASGYGDGYADAEVFRRVAEVSRELFGPATVLDAGCAKGFQVKALRSLGMEAWGIDISEYAVASAPRGVSSWLKVGSCTGMDFPDGEFDLVLALETLEHLPPPDIGEAVREMRRVARRWLLVSVPCMGENRYGRDGLLEGKVKGSRLDLYRENTIDLVPFGHLPLDVNGLPIHGHLTIASFAWWTSVFNRYGFVRRGDMERRLNGLLEPAREGIWNCMVLEKAVTPEGAAAAGEAGRPFREVGAGTWETEPLALPAGVHRVRVTLRTGGAGGRGEPLRRCLHCEGVSADGSRICASLLLNEGEARRAARKKELAVEMACACAGGEEICFRVTCPPRLLEEPPSLSGLLLHAPAQTACLRGGR